MDLIKSGWKYFACVMVAINIILCSFILFKFNSIGALRDIAENVDSTIVFSLSLLQTIIALGAFAGFYLVRNAAITAAKEEATKCSPACVNDWMNNNFDKTLTEALEDEDRSRDALRTALMDLGVYDALMDRAEETIYENNQDDIET